MTMEMIRHSLDIFAQKQEDWKKCLSQNILNMFTTGNSGMSNISTNLQEVWTNSTSQAETLRVTCQAHEGQLNSLKQNITILPRVVKDDRDPGEFLRSQETIIRQFVHTTTKEICAPLRDALTQLNRQCQDQFDLMSQREAQPMDPPPQYPPFEVV